MKDLFLIRGLPGSGKTEFANTVGCRAFSADDFFMVDGYYRFNSAMLSQAHRWCQQSTADAMISGAERVAVANTFTQAWEMKVYFDLAEEHGYRVFTMIMENRHGSTNIHNVPTDTIVKMRDRFEVVL